jgi:phosphatidylglycerol---prolipoprotein diacylglyceryl transferase
MHSILFRVGPIPIYAYGFMLMLAFVAGSAVAVRLAKQRGIRSEQVLDLTAVILVASIVGARLLYVALQWSYFRENPSHVWRIWEGGLSFQGGLAAGLLAGLVYCRRQGLSFLRMGDVMAPGAALGYAIGRIGCFLNGCCYGAPTSLPWACQFHDPPITGPLTPPSHPTQIYASLVNLGIFALLLLVWRRQRFTGQVLWSYLLAYAVYRFGIEFLRKGATAEVLALGMTHAQWASIGMALLAGGVLVRLSRRSGVQAFRRSGVQDGALKEHGRGAPAPNAGNRASTATSKK